MATTASQKFIVMLRFLETKSTGALGSLRDRGHHGGGSDRYGKLRICVGGGVQLTVIQD